MNRDNSQAKIFASIHTSNKCVSPLMSKLFELETDWLRVSSSHALVVRLIQLVTHVTTLLLSELHASCLAKAKQADIACTFCHNIWTTKLMTMEDTATISLEIGKTEVPPSLHEQWIISLLKHRWSQTFLISNQNLNLSTKLMSKHFELENWLIKLGLCCFDNQLLVSSSLHWLYSYS